MSDFLREHGDKYELGDKEEESDDSLDVPGSESDEEEGPEEENQLEKSTIMPS